MADQRDEGRAKNMRTAQRVAALLVAGTLDRDAWPELEEEQFAEEVRTRLASAGMSLVATPESFLARLEEPEGAPGFTPHARLSSVHKAMIAVLYLYLRYLPAQGDAGEEIADGQPPSVTPEDVFAPFSYKRHYLEKIVLAELKKQSYVRQVEGRLQAGDNLMAIDSVQLDLRAEEMLRRFLLKRFLERRVAEDAGERDATD
jgi:small nuclear ribonucleoprotein (snRNP)-like protein